MTTSFPSNIGCGTDFDFNNDGIQDLGFLQGANFLVELGTGKIEAPFAAGPLSAIPQESGYSVNCPSNPGDLNGDGIPDLLIPEVNSAGTATLLVPFYGAGNGSFVGGTPMSVMGGYGSLYLVDVNGDGKVDLITPQSNQVWYGNGNGTFQSPVTLVSGITTGITDVQWADLNGDGKLDFVVEANGYTYVLLATSGGVFTQTDFQSLCASCYLVSNFALGDLNGDGYPDLVIGSETATITWASRLAPATLFSIGCGGFVAVLTVHPQAYFRHTSSITWCELACRRERQNLERRGESGSARRLDRTRFSGTFGQRRMDSGQNARENALFHSGSHENDFGEVMLGRRHRCELRFTAPSGTSAKARVGRSE